jgi:glucokinase
MLVVAADVGGTTIKAGVLGSDGPVRTVRVLTERADGHVAVVDTLLATVEELVAGAGEPVDAVGLAVPGIVDEDRGIVSWSAAFDWHDLPLRDLVAERVGLPVAFGHDVRTGGLAEAILGAGRGYSSAMVVPIGTGLALAHVVDGKAISGATWSAGEIGQISLAATYGEGVRLEHVASGWSLARRFEKRTGAPEGSLGGADVLAEAAAGNVDAVAALDETIVALAETLSVAVTVCDPGVVVIGGGVSLAGEAFLRPFRKRLADCLGWREAPPVVPAQFGDEAGWLGAALLAHRLAGHPDAAFPIGAQP